jgi:putative DNA primase/helicase
VTAAVLPWLPTGWLEGIAAGDYVERARGEVGGLKKAWAWIKKRPDAKGELCSVMQAALDKGYENLEYGGSAHDELTDRSYQLLSLAVEGHRGAYVALVAFGRRFVDTVSGERRADALAGKEVGTIRGPEEARREVGRAVLGAVRLMLGHLNQPEMVEAGMADGASACACWFEPESVGADGLVVRQSSGLAKDPYEYELTETGNAQQLVDLVDGALVWVPGEKSWFSYDDEHHAWRGDEAVGVQWAMRLAPRVKAAAEQRFAAASGLDNQKNDNSAFSDADLAIKQAGKLFQWADRCGSRANIAATLDLAKSLPGVLVGAERFDANGNLLGVGAGEVLEFNDDGLVVRKAEREDYLTKTTGVPYVPGAKDELWENYLETFIPDLRLRDYVQRLLGYSLTGGNPRRLLVFLHGPTSSGKSTLVEAVAASLGKYGGPVGVSVFRDKQNDAPRPDLLDALRLRVAFSSEAGAEQHLHNDQIKRLTGGDSIAVRNMHDRVMQHLTPQFVPFIATNEPPHIENADAALWRRMLAVPFDVQVAGNGDDPLARERLRTSAGGRAAVLAWLVAGWEAYRERGLDDVPQMMVDRALEFRGEVSDFHAWFYTNVEFDPKARVEVGALYEMYRATMLSAGETKYLNSRQFGQHVSAELGTKAKQEWHKGKNAKFRLGIKLVRS